MNKIIFVILVMIFCHIVDEYYLQGWLASAKQKIYWAGNADERMYKFNYIWFLIMHSFSWSFMIMLPIAFVKGFDLTISFLVLFIFNVIIHAVTDDLKANKKKINLWGDQLIHICQIVLTAGLLL